MHRGFFKDQNKVPEAGRFLLLKKKQAATVGGLGRNENFCYIRSFFSP